MFPEGPVPKRIGDYRIVRRITGTGPFEIYVAREDGPLGFNREVTLRCVRRGEHDAMRAAELLREAKICARLNHPSIVRVLGFLEEGERYVLVLEHVEGVSLATLLALLEERREQLPLSAAAYVSATVASALASAHAHVGEDGSPQPILHRAISPSVVDVARDGSVKLGGFGLAKILDRTPDSVAGFVRASGELAPEVVRGEPATMRSDIFSLAALCYRLFSERSDTKPVIEAIAGRSPSLASVRSDVPRELAAAIDAALEPEPAKRSIPASEIAKWITRTASLEAGQRELRAIIETVPHEDVPEQQPMLSERPKRRARGIERSLSRMNALRRSSSDVNDEELELEPAPDSTSQAAPPAEEKVEPPPSLIETGRTRTMLGVGGASPIPAHRPALMSSSSAARNVVAPPAAPEPPPPPPPPAPAPTLAPALARPPAPAPAAAIAAASGVPSPPPIAFDEEPFGRRPNRGRLIAIGATVLGIVFLVVGVLALRKPAAEADKNDDTDKNDPVSAKSAAPSKPSAAPAASPSAAASKSAAACISSVPPPPAGKKLLRDFGWLYVRSEIENSRVFVAGRSRGEPNLVLMVPCGRLYVNLAKVDAKGNWRGWAAVGKTTDIPCDGRVGEVTFSKH